MKPQTCLVVKHEVCAKFLQQQLGSEFKVITTFGPLIACQFNLIIFVDGWNNDLPEHLCKEWVFDVLAARGTNDMVMIGCPYKTFPPIKV